MTDRARALHDFFHVLIAIIRKRRVSSREDMADFYRLRQQARVRRKQRQRQKNCNFWTRIKENRKAFSKRVRAKKKAFILAARNHPCTDCGMFYGVERMEFDHRSDKRFNMGEGTAHSWQAIREEIAKCDVICCTCHEKREIARGRQHSRSGPSECPNAYLPGGCRVPRESA